MYMVLFLVVLLIMIVWKLPRQGQLSGQVRLAVGRVSIGYNYQGWLDTNVMDQ